MSLVPTIYRSTDPGAPALTGQAGALTSLLRAVLVTGYGTGPDAKSGAGWTEAFASGNKSAFRNNTATASGFYLRIDDGQDDARGAYARAFKTMSNIDSGLDPAPTPAQSVNGLPWFKSSTADSASRAWVAVANERYVYLFIALQTQNAPWTGIAYWPLFAGDFQTRKPGDTYNYMVACPANWAGGTYGGGEWPGFLRTFLLADGQTMNACFVGRPYTGATGAVEASLAASSAAAQSSCWGGVGQYPDPVGNELIYERGVIKEGVMVARGFMPGVWVPLHDRPFADMSIVENVAGLPTGTRLLAKSFSQSTASPENYVGYRGQLLFDLTNPS